MTTLAYQAASALLPKLPSLLKAYWIAASASVLLTLLPLPLPSTFKAAVRLAASRGKLWHARPPGRPLGPLTNATVPQQMFEHFYIIGALVTTVLLQVYIFLCCEEEAGSSLKRDSILALLLFDIHVFRRYLETNYVMHYTEHARMHVLAYVFGLSYYVAAPLTLAPAFLLSMPTLEGVYTEFKSGNSLASVDARIAAAISAPHPERARLYAGLALYVLASLLQLSSHRRLGRLGREAEVRFHQSGVQQQLFPGGPGGAKGGKAPPMYIGPAPEPTDLYVPPTGGLFERVSCPHYLAEILIYVALAVVLRGTEGSLLILGWVVLNLLLAAAANHKWYLATFPDYPKGRKALIPGIF